MEYETIELEIGLGSGRQYPVAVRSPAGEAQGTIQFPFDELALENRLLNLQNALLRSGGERRQFLSTEQETVQKFGQALFNTIITDEVRICYEKSTDIVRQKGKGLRLQLRIQSPEMATLPWEFMYDPNHATYLALSPQTPIVRYINLPQTIEPLIVDPPLRLLGMIANPQQVQQLDIKREKERLERAIAPLQQSGLLELTWVQGETWRDLQRVLRNNRWHIFHFVGHGGFDTITKEGFIVLSDAQHQPHLLPATQLAEILTNYYPPRLVLLNSCDGAQSSKQDIFSSTASLLIRRNIPAVVAMQYEITDRAAIEFSSAFYEAVANGLSIEAAMSEAREAIWISINNTLEWGTPVLYTHAPDGVLFNVQKHIDEQIFPKNTTEYKVSTKEPFPQLILQPNEYRQIKEEEKELQQSLLQNSVPVKSEETKQSLLTFWLRWLLTNILGWAVGSFFMVVEGAPLMNPNNWLPGGGGGAMVAGVALAIGSITIGAAAVGGSQWFLLRRYIPLVRWWILASAIGGAIGGILGGALGGGLGYILVLVTRTPVSMIGSGALIGAGAGIGAVIGAGAGIGAAQQFILRSHIVESTHSKWASYLAWSLGGVAGGVAGLALIGGFIFAAITAFPIWDLIPHSTSNQTTE